MMLWSLLLDVVVAGLLVATIAYAVRLSRRLAVLREDRQQLQDMIKGLQKATQQAEEAVGGLRLGAADAGKGLHNIVERAQGLKADLLFITEKADSAADRLEAALKTQREAASPAETPPSAAREPRRRANPDLDAAAADAKGAQSRLASLLKQADNTPAPRPAPRPAPLAEAERATPQSRAERELQRALEGRR
jgi:hypothetical protein